VILKRTGSVAVAAAGAIAGLLVLAACGSNSNGSPAASGSSGSSSPSIQCQSGTIKASGSTAQKNAMTTWVNNYQSACSGATINYQASGSGAGIQDFINNQTAFAGSDSALTAAQITQASARCGSGNLAINIPMVGGPIAVAYNLSGVSKLIMTPQVLAGIFSNKITKWNDPAITAINPGVSLPSATIVSFHRSDSSGTTDNFTKYLTASAGSAWTYAHNKVWPAPGGQGAKGSDQVAASIKSTPNSIGYIEFSFTQAGGMGVAQIDNGGGPVTLSIATASAGIDSAKVVGTGNDLTLQLDYATKTAGAYPIVLVTYEITCYKGLSAADLGVTKSFLTYTASSAGQGTLAAQGYAPLPSSLIGKVQTVVAGIS
jgi:phosphate transport system substrate-binding protein